jgi:hypothetical protein
MKTFIVYFRSDLQWGRRDLKAATAEQALAKARQLANDDWDSLDLDYSEPCDCPINEIEICNKKDEKTVTGWFDDDMRLRLAAPERWPLPNWSLRVGSEAISRTRFVSCPQLSRKPEVLHERLLHHAPPCPRLSGGDDAALRRGDPRQLPHQPQAGVAIVSVDHVGEGKIGVMPLFVAITEDMDTAFEGEVGGGDGGGGGPRRKFKTNKDATRPSYDVS